MPTLKAFGRRWNVGSDDIAVSTVLEASANGIWLGWLGFSYIRQRPSIHCTNPAVVYSFYNYGMLFVSINILLLLSMLHTSFRGTVINDGPRLRLGKQLAAKMVMNIASIVFVLTGTRYVYLELIPCETTVIETLRAAVKSAWAISLAGLMSFWVLLRLEKNDKRMKVKVPKSESTRHVDLERSDSVFSVTSKSWHQRWESIGKSLGLNGHPVISDLGSLFADLFREEVDVVPSDVITALCLLERDQNYRKEQAMTSLARAPTVIPSTTGTPNKTRMVIKPWMSLRESQHYMRFSAGAYGWPMYVFSSMTAAVGLAKVLVKCRYIPRQNPSHIVNDNAMLANTAVIHMCTRLASNDLVYATFHNKLFEVPFYIAYDHVHKGIVVAIRGTLSLEDIIVDLTGFASDPFHVSGVSDCKAHDGMLQAARNIMTRLIGYNDQNKEIDDCNPLLVEAKQKLGYMIGDENAKEYGLVITGHSLGAGIAGILAILMHEIEEYKDLKCFAYSPPPVLSASACEHAKSFVCSVVLGDDIVPRLGVPLIYDIKLKVFQLLKNLDIPKHEVIGNWLFGAIRRSLGIKSKHRRIDDPPSWEGNETEKLIVQQYQSELERVIEGCLADLARIQRLYLPGNVMFIRETIHTKYYGLSRRRNFKAYWIDGRSDIFKETWFVGDIIDHHTPWAVLEALSSICQKHQRQQ